ncbi:hypothetical protein D3C84_953060 [compost metagenome]
MIEHFLDGRFKCVSQFWDVTRENSVIFYCLYTCTDGAAALMPQYEDQWCAEHRDSVFKACQTLIGNEIARDAYGEKIASCSVKSILRCNAGVRATEYRHKRVLA